MSYQPNTNLCYNSTISKLKIAFFFGGVSPEHEVSIITAIQAMASLPPEYESIPVYVGKTGEIYTGDRLKDIKTYQNLELVNQSPLGRDRGVWWVT
jgi:D-alanine-D-alanine ligase